MTDFTLGLEGWQVRLLRHLSDKHLGFFFYYYFKFIRLAGCCKASYLLQVNDLSYDYGTLIEKNFVKCYFKFHMTKKNREQPVVNTIKILEYSIFSPLFAAFFPNKHLALPPTGKKALVLESQRSKTWLVLSPT